MAQNPEISSAFPASKNSGGSPPPTSPVGAVFSTDGERFSIASNCGAAHFAACFFPACSACSIACNGSGSKKKARFSGAFEVCQKDVQRPSTI